MKVLRLEVSVYNVEIKDQFQTTFAQKGGGGETLVEVIVNSKEENSEDFVPITSENSASGEESGWLTDETKYVRAGGEAMATLCQQQK